MTRIFDPMACIEIPEPGGPEVLTPARRLTPSPGRGQALIAVAAAGVNRADVIQRRGHYPPPPGASDVPGLEIAGTVVALGEGVETPRVGEAVCALLSGGGYASRAVADAALCLPIPDGLTAIEAAALPETFFTVWHTVFERAALKPGETCLVHGGASGIGSTALQLAKAFGATAWATAGTDEKRAACGSFGADHAVNYRTEDYLSVFKKMGGADVILDMVGGDYIARDVRLLKVEGRRVSIAFLKGSKVELDFMPVLLKRLSLMGSVLRSQPLKSKTRIAKALKRTVWPLIEAGVVRPHIHATLALENAADAHVLMESGAHIGKIVLTVNA